MKTNFKMSLVALSALLGAVALAPTASMAQSRSKSATQHSSTKAKKVVKHKKSQKRMKVTAKAKAPKPGVMKQGSFRPFRSDGRMTVLVQSKPVQAADLAAAQRRKGVLTVRTMRPSAQTIGNINSGNFETTSMIVNSRSTSWWGNGGPTSTTHYEQGYGFITVVNYSWGNVMYTYGYQVVNYWNGTGYSWISYPGQAGVAYPVIYR